MLDHVLNVATVRQAVDDGSASADDDTLLSFLRAGLKRLQGSHFEQASAPSEAQLQGLESMRRALAAAPLSDRKRETLQLAELCTKLGHWLGAADIVSSILPVQGVEVMYTNKRTSSDRLKEWALAKTVLSNLAEQESQSLDDTKAYVDAAFRVASALPHAAFDATFAAQAYAIVARLALRGSEPEDDQAANELLEHVRRARGGFGDARTAAKHWQTGFSDIEEMRLAPYGGLELPRDLLSVDAQNRLALWAPALSMDLVRIFASSDDLSEFFEVQRAFVYAMHHPQGARVLFDALREIRPLFPDGDDDLNAEMGHRGRLLADAMFYQLNADTADHVWGHVCEQAMVFADAFFALFVAASPPDDAFQGEAAFDVTTVVGARALDSDASMRDNDAEARGKLRDSVLDIASTLLETPGQLHFGLAYLFGRADLFAQCTPEQKARLQKALLATPAQQQVENLALDLLGDMTDIAIGAPQAMGPSSKALRHLAQLADFCFSVAEHRGIPEPELRNWLALILGGIYVNGQLPEADVHLEVWRALAKRVTSKFVWVYRDYNREQLDLQLDNAHAMAHVKALRIAQQAVKNLALDPIAGTPQPNPQRRKHKPAVQAAAPAPAPVVYASQPESNDRPVGGAFAVQMEQLDRLARLRLEQSTAGVSIDVAAGKAEVAEEPQRIPLPYGDSTNTLDNIRSARQVRGTAVERWSFSDTDAPARLEALDDDDASQASTVILDVD